jgi:hypothetical protein
MEFIYKRLREMFPDATGSEADEKELNKIFGEFSFLELERKRILELLPHAGFDREKLMVDIIAVEDRMRWIREDVADLGGEHPETSKLLSPVLLLNNIDDINELNLLYKRELAKSLFERIRFFNETLILRIAPLDDDERRLEKEGIGKTQNIHLSYDARRFTEEDGIEPEVMEEEIQKASEKLDLDFILSEEDQREHYVKSAPIDLELIRTEPGSDEDIKLRRKKKERPDSALPLV